MQKIITNITEKKLIGLNCWTSFANELNPATSKIMQLVNRYMNEKEAIPNVINPEETICAYYAYEDEYKGGYTYFIGKEVSSIIGTPKGFSTLIIPEGQYAKYTTDSGIMPMVVIEAWQKIWLDDQSGELGGKRSYMVDFEVYDSKRAANPSSTILDLYVGIEK